MLSFEYGEIMEHKIEDFNVILKKITVAHKYTYNAQSIYGYENNRKNYGLVYLLSGKLDYSFSDGRSATLTASDFFLLKPTDSYKVYCRETCEHYTVNFSLDESEIEGSSTKNILFNEPFSKLKGGLTNKYYVDTLDELCSVWSRKESGYQMSAISLLYKLLHFYLSSQVENFRSEEFLRLLPAKEYLEGHWQENLTLAVLAKKCSLSVAHFRHMFFRVFNMPPMKYRDNLRLIYAKDYLAQEHFSVSDVAYKCGFDDVNYFSRFFKKHVGVSPLRYIKKQ